MNQSDGSQSALGVVVDRSAIVMCCGGCVFCVSLLGYAVCCTNDVFMGLLEGLNRLEECYSVAFAVVPGLCRCKQMPI